MNSPACFFRTGWLLLVAAAGLAGAETSTVTANPTGPDLLRPAAGATSDAASNSSLLPPELKLTARFDRTNDHRLDATERQAARQYLVENPAADPTPASGRPGQLGLPDAPLEPVRPGEKISPASTPAYGNQPLYDSPVLRTLFLDFEESDWEQELADFARTDVLVPARLQLDGHTYPGVGVHFCRAADDSSASPGYKRSLDLQLDFSVAGQRLGNQRALRLLAARSDPTFLRTMLYTRVAREYGPTPGANFVRVVINGENWGVYVSVQPFDENFIQENFHTSAGARWTVRPGGNLAYLGDNPEAYRHTYQLESPEDPAAWTALIHLCKILNQASPDEFRAALAPVLDLDSTLMFLALENTLINQDGYGGTSGGYALYLDRGGRFHLIPQNADHSFRLVRVTEYGERRADRVEKGDAKRKDGSPTGDEIPKGYNPNDFPHQTGTNLAMLLSYSFINKADTDLDGIVTKEEWLTFARVWFAVMDEDFAGRLTREQFLAKIRLLITPTSIADGRSQQTFGRDDPAGMIGQDFFAVLDANHDNQLTREEMTNAFEHWFTEWTDPKTGRLTQRLLQKGFSKLFSRSVFQADQVFIAKKNELRPSDGERSEERGKRSGGNSVGIGPLRIPGFGGGRGASAGRRLITFHEELDPLAGQDDPTKPLLFKLLSDPGLRAHYLEFTKDITENWLDWAKLGPIAKEYHELIAADVAKDTHKAASYEHFVQELDQDTTQGAREGDEAPSLRNFITERRSYLMKSDASSGGY